ncbi:hypothetical protein KM043_004445 [Ampulex compressa]|nr:hypothetical protein KM043_004445 [Ampulex compressa]
MSDIQRIPAIPEMTRAAYTEIIHPPAFRALQSLQSGPPRLLVRLSRSKSTLANPQEASSSCRGYPSSEIEAALRTEAGYTNERWKASGERSRDMETVMKQGTTPTSNYARLTRLCTATWRLEYPTRPPHPTSRPLRHPPAAGDRGGGAAPLGEEGRRVVEHRRYLPAGAVTPPTGERGTEMDIWLDREEERRG